MKSFFHTFYLISAAEKEAEVKCIFLMTNAARSLGTILGLDNLALNLFYPQICTYFTANNLKLSNKLSLILQLLQILTYILQANFLEHYFGPEFHGCKDK